MAQLQEPDTKVDPPAPVGSFEELYRAEYQRMVSVAFLLVGGAAAEEVTQDAFARVFERWGTLDRPAGYLRTCVVNRSRDVLRRRRLAVWWRPDPVPDPLLGADELLDALSCLSPTRRAAVVLRYYEDLSEADIATALGVRPGTVKSMLHRSLHQLREVIER